MIAMALANDPRLLIADEPTTALDVTVQAQILALIRRLQDELDTAVVMITHDLGVIAETADDVAVMYAGRIVEHAPTSSTIFNAPEHPYTWGLLRSIPRLDVAARRAARADPGPAAEPDQPARAAARSTRAARTCASATSRSTRRSSRCRASPATASRACCDRETRRKLWAELRKAGRRAEARAPRCSSRRRRRHERRAARRGPRPRQALPAHARDHLPAAGRRRARGRRRVAST